VELHRITELLHEKNTTAAYLEYIFGASRVGYGIKVEPTAFIADAHGQGVPLFAQLDLDRLGFVFAIAVYDGIIYGFGKCDQDIAVDIRVDLVLLGSPFYEGLHQGNISGVGGKL
jgi:hypothetical protein